MKILSNCPAKKVLRKAGLVLVLGFASGVGQTAFAAVGGDCHFHGRSPAKEETVTMCAEKRKIKLIDKGTIASSWKNVSQSSIEQIDGKKGKEWKVIFKNSSVSDKSKETLYMFFALSGNFIAANFSGK